MRLINKYWTYIRNLVKNWYDKRGGKSIILIYHRVFELSNDDQLLAVSPSNFESQIKWLKENYHVISLENLVDQIQNRSVINGSVVITFDDGYADNYKYAQPILEKYNVPATFFVTVDNILKSKGFWWDGLVFDREDFLKTRIDKRPNKYRVKPNSKVMTLSQLKDLSSREGVEIGSHTLTHPVLSIENSDVQKREIVLSRRKLKKMLKKEINYFSYPFGTSGEVSGQTIRIAKNAGYRAAVINEAGLVTSRSELLKLPRCLVRNWDVLLFSKKIKSYFSPIDIFEVIKNKVNVKK